MRSASDLFEEELFFSNGTNVSHVVAALSATPGHVMSLLARSGMHHQIARMSDGEMSDMTRWIITAAILLSSFLIVASMRCITVRIDELEVDIGRSSRRSSSRSASPLSPRAHSMRQPDLRDATPGGSYRSPRPGSSPPGSPRGDYLFMSYGRIKDCQMMASCCPSEEKGHAAGFEEDTTHLLKLVKKKNFKSGSKDKLENKKRECRILYLIDDKSEFVTSVMVRLDAHEDQVYSTLYALQAAAKKYAQDAETCERGGLDLALHGTMKDLLSSRSTSPHTPHGKSPHRSTRATAISNVTNNLVLDKMDDVNRSMRQSVRMVQDNDRALTDLSKDTRRMDERAHAFGETARVAAWKHHVNRYKWYIYIGLIIFDVIAIALVWAI